jgi:SAM-dependent methyltransferase
MHPYKTRRLSEGAADLDRLAVEYFVASQSNKPDDTPRVERVLALIDRLIPLSAGCTTCVIGCGPVPQTLKVLRARGFNAIGVEPIPGFVTQACEYLDDPASVLRGSAESLPLQTASQDIVFFENVLEHVESPSQSLREIFRVVKPGGVVYVTTTNRQRLSLVGENGEFRVPFFNLFPRLVKESYVFTHLHYRPELANFTSRPAVHWFSYADLCALGRDAGFAQFYSPFDLRRSEDDVRSSSLPKKAIRALGLIPLVQRHPVLRSLALTQLGSDIFMLRRREP